MEILKVLVGSHAHGLATEDSDVDYRGVYVTPTSQILSLHAGKMKGTHWVEGENEDATSYELGHFLFLALKCNPSILEVFRATSTTWYPIGVELRALFPYVWTPKGVAAAFGGYSLNQRKKCLDNHLGRRWKFAVAYIRVLIQGIQLLTEGTFSLRVPDTVPDYPITAIGHLPGYLKAVKRGAVSMGEIIDVAEHLRDQLNSLANTGPFIEHHPDVDRVNAFLLKVRKENW